MSSNRIKVRCSRFSLFSRWVPRFLLNLTVQACDAGVHAGISWSAMIFEWWMASYIAFVSWTNVSAEPAGCAVHALMPFFFPSRGRFKKRAFSSTAQLVSRFRDVCSLLNSVVSFLIELFLLGYVSPGFQICGTKRVLLWRRRNSAGR